MPKDFVFIPTDHLANPVEITKLGSRQILLGLLDVGVGLTYIGDYSKFYRQAINDYWRWRAEDRRQFVRAVKNLKQQGLIRQYRQGKEPVLTLTKKGRERALRAYINDVSISIPAIWNKKWHMIIFDIPERQRQARDIFRKRLRDLGFLQIQKSVFVHPFDATDLVAGIRLSFGLTKEIQYVVADQIEQEEAMIERFLRRGTLRKEHFV